MNLKTKMLTFVNLVRKKQREVKFEDNLLFHHILLLLVLRSGQTHFFLPLVVHHFLNHPTGFSVQIRELQDEICRIKSSLES